MADSEEDRKSLLMKVKEESEKSWLKAQHSENEDHGIWSHGFMQINGETMDTKLKWKKQEENKEVECRREKGRRMEECVKEMEGDKTG